MFLELEFYSVPVGIVFTCFQVWLDFVDLTYISEDALQQIGEEVLKCTTIFCSQQLRMDVLYLSEMLEFRVKCELEGLEYPILKG